MSRPIQKLYDGGFSPTPVEISEDDWGRLEVALSCKLSADMRGEIQRLCDAYRRDAEWDKQCPRVRDVSSDLQQWIDVIAPVLALWEARNLDKKREGFPEGTPEVAQYNRNVWAVVHKAMCHVGADAEGRDAIHQIQRERDLANSAMFLLQAMLDGARDERARIDSGEDPRLEKEPEAFDTLIVQIKALLRKNDINAGVRQDGYGSIAKPSPFTRFIALLSGLLNGPRHNSMEAWAKAISRAD